jgi:hypothetical protein
MNQPPLCVDLDGTLVAIDTLKKCLNLLVREKPWLSPLLPLLSDPKTYLPDGVVVGCPIGNGAAHLGQREWKLVPASFARALPRQNMPPPQAVENSLSWGHTSGLA